MLIPAYEPDLRLVHLVRDLRSALPHARVLVMDDGSGPGYDGVFQVAADAGAHVERAATNRGKGVALKRGFAWAAEHAPGETVVCADCDGQHTPSDIAAVASLVRPGTRSMVLGERSFTAASGPPVPLRSRLGNTVTRWLFRAVTGTRVNDTQTGLRAYPADVLGWLQSVPGDRFEYEFTLLLRARGAGVEIHQTSIQTIYLDANESSHFRPVVDSLRIYAPLLRFAASSLAGYALDVVALLLLSRLGAPLVAAILGARVVSAAANFAINRDLVFGHAGPATRAAGRYAVLAAALLGANACLMTLLVTGWGVSLLVAKVVVEALLFTVSYAAQQRLVFTGPASASLPVRVDA